MSNKTEYTNSLLPSLSSLPLVCPQCREAVQLREACFYCSPCDRKYPLHGGIPDFRLSPDPYLDWEEDRKRTDFVIASLNRFNLEGLLEHYWSVSDVTPERLRGKYIRSAMLGESKAKRVLKILRDSPFNSTIIPEKLLDIGSGTGNMLAVAVSEFKQVVGLDVGMRWLHVCRRRFMDKGMEVPPLVCCNAEHLPFTDGYFDLITCSATLEFTRDQDKVFGECARTLDSNGGVYISTVNRYSIARDPYVYLWGVGLLPRAWQAPYVRWRRNASYENIRLLSLNELTCMARKYFRSIQVALPDIDDESLRQFSWAKRIQVRIYRLLRKAPLIRKLLLWVAPQWDIKLMKNPD